MKMTKQQILAAVEEAEKRESKLCHLIMVPFTGLGKANGFRGDEWFAKRIKIFKENTLPSLLAQTNPFFTVWMTFRNEELINPLTKELWDHMKKLAVPMVFTFGGIPMWDDKYPDEVESQRLLQRFKDSLPELKGIVGDAEYVYETILASDDMYHKDVVKTIHDYPYEERGALVHWQGYIREIETGRLGIWQPPQGHLPPFYTIMYPADTFLDPQKHFDYLKGYKSHEDVERLFKCTVMPDGRYVVNVHGNNISTCWMGYKHEALEKTQHDFISKEFTDEKEKKSILKDFGICQK